MSQYRARKKALNQKRDQMMDLFVDSRIKLANKPTTYGEFYDYVIDLDRPVPQASRLVEKALPQAKPAVPEKAVQTTQPTAQQKQKAKPVEPTAAPQTTADQKPTQESNTNSNFWDSYTR